MALEIVDGKPGLWRDPEWALGMPGVYALIIGASAYPHLDKDNPEATYGLGQLVSSANTAAALFEWLRDDFRLRGLSVVWCYLLLSPTAEEKAKFADRGLLHYALPDNDALRKAIQSWTGSVPREAPANRQSRTLFFFSGHGVQSNYNPLLLPSDYLDRSLGYPQLENCIGASELRKWMEENAVAEHLALIDACRNEFSPLASKGATALTSFPTTPPGGLAPRSAVTLNATSPNTVAYQALGRPYTFFGQAVLEALRGSAGADDSRVEFRELVDYVKPRVNALLKEAGAAALDQTVRPRIDGDDELVVTEIAPAAPVAKAMAQLRSRSVAKSVVLEATAARFKGSLAVRQAIELSDLRDNFLETHRRFGHEYASDVWLRGVALYALDDGRRIDSGATVLAVERDDASSIVQVDLAIHSQRQGVLLVFEGAEYVQRERLAVALPTDLGTDVPIRLTLTIARSDKDTQPKIQKLEARLGSSGHNLLFDYLWSLTLEADLGSLRAVAAKADPERLMGAAQAKTSSQTAATAGMLLLARAGRIGDVRDWTRNLMQWFPWIPDGAVLWAESLRSASACGDTQPYGVANGIDEMVSALQTLRTRGLPFFADSLDFAESLVRYALRHPLSTARRKNLEEIALWIEQVFQIAMPSGHFIVLYGLPRPKWLAAGQGALSVKEMFDILRSPAQAGQTHALT